MMAVVRAAAGVTDDEKRAWKHNEERFPNAKKLEMLHWFIEKGEEGTTDVGKAFRGVYFNPARSVEDSHVAGPA